MAGVICVYTDGACSGNPGPGGWAWVVPDGPFASGAAADTTNQRMELTAVLEAVRSLDGPLEILSDSTYVVNCFRDGWWEGWLRRGWKNAKREPVANRDLWEPLIALVRERDIDFRWVKGHGGDRWNDLADRLAVEAAQSQVGRRGDHPPDLVGPPDRPRRASSGRRELEWHGDAELVEADPEEVADALAEARAALEAHEVPRDPTGREPPVGHRLLVGGDRARHVDADGPEAVAVRRRLAEILAAKAELHPDLVVLAGLRQGAETLAAEAARDAGVRWVAVLPYPAPEARWPAAARTRFAELLASADEVITLQAKEPATVERARGAIARRDAWFIRNAHEAIVVWDGDDDETRKLVRRLEEVLGDDVWIVDPATV